jgi:hypothetical protein
VVKIYGNAGRIVTGTTHIVLPDRPFSARCPAAAARTVESAVQGLGVVEALDQVEDLTVVEDLDQVEQLAASAAAEVDVVEDCPCTGADGCACACGDCPCRDQEATDRLDQVATGATNNSGTVISTTWPPPVAPSVPASNRWSDFVWPAWVPADVRLPVEGFWSEDNGRGPRAWADDAVAQGSYPFGVVVTAHDGLAPSRTALATGRWVHAWNNIGRLVLEDGSWTYSSFSLADVARWRSEVEAHRQVHDDPATAEQLARQEQAAAQAQLGPAPAPGRELSQPAVQQPTVQQRPTGSDPVPCEDCGLVVTAEYVARTGQALHGVCAARRAGRAA